MFFRNMKIRTKLTFSFLLAIFLFASALITGVMQIKKISMKSGNLYTKEVWPLEALLAVKSDFAELRRTTTVVAMRGLLENQEDIESSIEAAENKYSDLKACSEMYLSRLREINEPTQSYEAANVLIAVIYNDYWPVIQEIFDASRNNNIDVMMEHVTEASEIAASVEAKVTELSAAKLTEATKNTDEVSTIANSAMFILLVIGLITIMLSLVLALYIGSSISKRINALSGVAKELAGGRLNVKTNDSSADELGELARDLESVESSISNVTSSLSELTNKFKNGIISAKADTTKTEGAYKAICEEVNSMFATVIDDTLSFFNCVVEFGNGNFDATANEMIGEKMVMTNSLEAIRSKLKSVISDINGLVGAAAQGKLSTRVEAEQYSGDWIKMMNSLNQLMEVIAMPISEVEIVLSDVAKGDFSKKISGDYKGDFLLIKNSVNNTIENMYSYIDEISGILASIAENNLDRWISREYVGEFSKIKNALNNIIEKFNSIIAEISSSSQQVAMGSKQVSESSMSLSEGTTEQAASVQELSATIQNINEATSCNAENAKEAESLSQRSKLNAADGDKQMKNMLTSMEGIKQSSNSISKIIKVIDDIAFQTNLLALNAAVEGARAGVHGKGFAVVAEEVRNLAARSQSAAKETSQLIEESIERVNEGTQMADKTAFALQTIVEDVSKTAGIITSIAEASQEQAAAISQINEGLGQITEVVQSNSATSEEAASSAQQLYSQSELLKEMVSVFKLKKK